MNPEQPQLITRLLLEWGAGSQQAFDQLTPLVYEELRRLAGAYMHREQPGHTLQATALVHEAYLRLVEQSSQNWQNRNHFFGVAAHLMRVILVDWARKNHADKRGGGALHITLDRIDAGVEQSSDVLLALDDALTRLAALDERRARIVELRYFGGMTVPETALTIGISTATVERETRLALLWLSSFMTGAGS